MTDNIIATGSPTDLATLKSEYRTILRSNTNEANLCSLGYCPAFVIIRCPSKPDGTRGEVVAEYIFSEAAAVVSYPRKGKLVIPGIASQPSVASTGVRIAWEWVKRNWDGLKEHLGVPYIDPFKMLRLRQEGDKAGIPYGRETAEEEDEEEGEAEEDDLDDMEVEEEEEVDDATAEEIRREFPYVDIILHLPPHVNSSYLQTSMIIAIVMMAWRKRVDLSGCIVMGTLDSAGRVAGYPKLGQDALQEFINWGVDKIVVATRDAEMLQAGAEEGGIDLDEQGITITGCDTMMHMVRAVFPN